MGYGVSAVITRAGKRYPDLNDGGTLGLSLLQETHDELLTLARIAIDLERLSVTAEDLDVAIPSTVKKIWSASWVRSATEGDAKRLEMRSIRWLDTYKPRWRDHGSGEPSILAINADNTGDRLAVLHRKPDTTSTGTPTAYPHVRLEISEKLTLVTGAPVAGETNELPDAVDDMSVYLEGVWKRFARLFAPENEAEHDARFQIAKNNLLATLKLHVAEDVPVLTPGWAQLGAPTT